MTRLQKKLSDKKSLIVFITAGDPDLETTLQIMKTMAEEKVDCIELGMPFSDPIADGAVIQRATSRALEQKVRLGNIFHLVRRFRQVYDTPIVLMGYLNPILHMKSEPFMLQARAAGVDGLIIADLPFEEGEEMEALCEKYDMALIYLLAPELSTERTRSVVNASTGFIYCIAQYGTTGSETGEPANLQSVVGSIRSYTDKPVMIGFGVSSKEKAGQICKYADGVIIGSWLIRELERATDKPECARDFVKSLKKSISLGI